MHNVCTININYKWLYSWLVMNLSIVYLVYLVSLDRVLIDVARPFLEVDAWREIRNYVAMVTPL